MLGPSSNGYFLSRTVAPTRRPVSLQEAKDHMRVRIDDEDALIDACIDTIVASLDGPAGILNSALLTQTLVLTMSRFCSPIELPCAPVQVVSSIEYQDGGSPTFTTLPQSAWRFSGDARRAQILPAPNTYFPVTAWGLADAVRITFLAGYGDVPANVPAPIRQAILLNVAHLYENRETEIIGTILTKLPTADALIAPYRNHWMAA